MGRCENNVNNLTRAIVSVSFKFKLRIICRDLISSVKMYSICMIGSKIHNCVGKKTS